MLIYLRATKSLAWESNFDLQKIQLGSTLVSHLLLIKYWPYLCVEGQTKINTVGIFNFSKVKFNLYCKL